jgi:hypothetical protein
MIEINKTPTRKELRLFSCLWFPLAGAILGTSMYLHLKEHAAFSVWGFSVAMLITGALSPKLVRPIFLAMTYLTYPVGFCLSYVVLALIFLLVMTPISIGMRFCRFDPLARKFDQKTSSYWSKRKEDRDSGRPFSQF